MARWKMSAMGKPPTMWGWPTYKKTLQFVLVIVMCPAITLGALAYNTASQTINELWTAEGHAFDTKPQYWKSLFVGSYLIDITSSGQYRLEEWPASILDRFNKMQYQSAIEKIPLNDFERVYWYYWTIFLPKNQNKPDREKYAAELLPIVIEQMREFSHLSRASRIVDDVQYHLVLWQYSNYFFETAPKISPDLYRANKDMVLNLMYDSAMTIKPSVAAGYDSDYAKNSVFNSLSNAYVRFANDFYVAGICKTSRAKQWEEISDKMYDVLIRDPQNAAAYLPTQSTRDRYANFLKTFNERDQSLRAGIAKKC